MNARDRATVQRTGAPAGHILPGALLVLVLLLSRVPLLFRGYGSDNDSWRNVIAIFRMQALGHYVPSRMPGFPVFEGLMSLLVPFGPLATNAAAIVAGCVSVIFFGRIAARLRPAARLPLLLGFAFSAPVWVCLSQSMDYAFGLCLMLIAFDLLLAGRSAPAAVLLGLATGCRATYVLFALPVLVFLWLRPGGRRAILPTALLYGVTVALVFLPVKLFPDPETVNLGGRFERHFQHAHVTLGTLLPAVRAGVVFLFGKIAIGVLAALTVLAMLLPGMRPSGSRGGGPAGPDAALDRAALGFELAACFVVAAFYLMIPYEGAYLLPMFPFALLLVARFLRPGMVGVMALFLVLECLVTVEPRHGREAPVPGRFFEELSVRQADLDTTAVLDSLHPAGRTVFNVGQFNVHRLLALHRARYRNTEVAWSYLHWQGVALFDREDPYKAFATELSATQVDSLHAAGWDVVNRRPLGAMR